MKSISFLMLFLLMLTSICTLAIAGGNATVSEVVTLDTGTGILEGTLLVPDANRPVPVALIIAGSGPTDRNGNQPMMVNNSLKFLAEELADAGIASLRFDKRGIAASSGAMISESELRFEHYVDDAAGWIALLQEDARFNAVIVVGHSEGSLIGKLAAKQAGATGFISLAGMGRSMDQVIRTQLQSQPAFVLDIALPILDQLVEGTMVEEIPPMLQPLFRKSVQPYLISVFKHNPSEVIASLDIPVMIVQGSTDIQIGLDEAELLRAASPAAEVAVFEGMNHILKEAPSDFQQNIATYSNPDIPLFSGLSPAIAAFIRSIE
jgi:uncharacterized protein